MKRLFLIDGSGYIFRAFYALPPMTRSDGTPVNAVYGFTNMLMRLVSEMQAEYAVVVFDAARKNFRNDIYADYKANRKETPEELIPQFPLLRDAVGAFGLPMLEKEGFEADDLIATLANKAAAENMEVTVISADKDLMQLVNDQIKLYDPIKNKFINIPEVVDKFGVVPEKVIDVQALAGDTSDNIPGVPGIGVKTAALLINEYDTLENLLDNAAKIKQNKRRELLIEHKDLALISKKLVTLCPNVPLDDIKIDDFLTKAPLLDDVLNFIEIHEFRSLKTKAESWLKKFNNNRENKTISEPLLYSENNSIKVDNTSKKPPVYKLIQDLPSLKSTLKEAEKKGYFAIDTETDSLDPHSAHLVGISLAFEENEAFYIPVGHIAKKAQSSFDFFDTAEPTELLPQIPLKDVLSELKPLLEDKGLLKIGHNIKFDYHVFVKAYQGNLALSPIDDTMVMSYVLDGSKNGHGMDELAKIHLNHQTILFKDVCDKKKGIKNFAEVELNEAAQYAAEDADVTLKLWHFFKKRLLEEKMVTLYETIERPLINVLCAMEQRGILVDSTKLNEAKFEFEKYIKDFEAEIFNLSETEFNIGSPKQLGEILFEKMGINTGKKTATGSWSTDAETLENLRDEGHKIAEYILKWRQFSKLKNTYTDALVNQINPQTKRVHTSFAQTITSTGRLSSSNPNLQNIPARNEEGRKIRQAFIAPSNYSLVAADYSQVELRLVAHVANIPAMKRAFENGVDIHAATASEVFGIPIEGMDSLIRRKAKAINFGIIYGISPFGLAAQLGISRGEAKEYIDSYFAKFPEINQYMEETKIFARKNGFVLTPFGRKCYIDGINHKNGNIRGFAERAAINAPIQGGAADIIKMAMIKIEKEITKEAMNAKMLLQVHDELIFETPKENADNLAQKIKGIMADIVNLSVPLIVDAGIANNWEEAH
ncbi:MAG: DNA polymerase I [Alphaproteobacteria bacterium]